MLEIRRDMKGGYLPTNILLMHRATAQPFHPANAQCLGGSFILALVRVKLAPMPP